MSTIQNLKNFIRHGKQARAAEPTTNVSPVHAQPAKYNNNFAQPAFGISEPNLLDRQYNPQQQALAQGGAGGYSAAAVDNRNVAARAGEAAAHAADKQQKIQEIKEERGRDMAPDVLEKLVAEERDSKNKMPKYPGLERWVLVEKMGDGAFSNVYRARDTQGQYPEVAIKVVRKFEMNNSQVSNSHNPCVCPSHTAFLDVCRGTHKALLISPLCPLPLVDCPRMANIEDNLGRRCTPSRLQEEKGAKNCGGAQVYFLYQQTFVYLFNPVSRSS